MYFRFGILLVIVLVIGGECSRDPFQTLVAYEAKQRLAAGVDENSYQLFPFRISADPQNFVHIPKTQ